VSDLDPKAVLVGALVALAIAVPPAVAAQVWSDRGTLEGSNLVLLLFALVLVAFGAGGWFAARRAAAAPLLNGAVAAVAAFVIVQGYGVVRRLADGDELRWLGMVVAGLLAASCGTVGAVLASMRDHRSS